MKIIFMGTPDLAAGVLQTMMEHGCDVSLVVTQPDRPRGRGRSVIQTPVHQCADKWGIPTFAPVKVKEAEAVQRLREENPDLIVVAAFGQILSQEILDLPRYGCINVHASLLPRYRGAAPIQWAVIDGEKESGVTIMQMNAGLDTGDILTQRAVPIDEKETGESLYDKLTLIGGQLLMETLPMIEAGTLTPVSQDDAQSSYASMLRKDMGNIDWSRPAGEIERLIRGLNSWPGAYTYWNGKMLKIWGSELTEERKGEDSRPGTVLRTGKELVIACGDGALSLTDVQLSGKKRMAADAFLRGQRLQAGDVLTSDPNAEAILG